MLHSTTTQQASKQKRFSFIKMVLFLLKRFFFVLFSPSWCCRWPHAEIPHCGYTPLTTSFCTVVQQSSCAGLVVRFCQCECSLVCSSIFVFFFVYVDRLMMGKNFWARDFGLQIINHTHTRADSHTKKYYFS